MKERCDAIDKEVSRISIGKRWFRWTPLSPADSVSVIQSSACSIGPIPNTNMVSTFSVGSAFAKTAKLV